MILEKRTVYGYVKKGSHSGLNKFVSQPPGHSLVIENKFMSFTRWYFFISNRQQKEREIRHKIKQGDLADIPKDVLETMAPSLLMPSKGMFGNLFIVLQFCLNGFRTRRPNH